MHKSSTILHHLFFYKQLYDWFQQMFFWVLNSLPLCVSFPFSWFSVKCDRSQWGTFGNWTISTRCGINEVLDARITNINFELLLTESANYNERDKMGHICRTDFLALAVNGMRRGFGFKTHAFKNLTFRSPAVICSLFKSTRIDILVESPDAPCDSMNDCRK